MKTDRKTIARQMLDEYLSTGNHRRTAERYAILSVLYDTPTALSLAEIDTRLREENMAVSTATLYNCMALFEHLHIVACHRLQGRVLYEAAVGKQGTTLQVCTVCGKVKLISDPAITKAATTVRTGRFSKAFFTTYLYGTCASCVSKSHAKKRKAAETEEKNAKVKSKRAIKG